jgi:hypothetical protein
MNYSSELLVYLDIHAGINAREGGDGRMGKGSLGSDSVSRYPDLSDGGKNITV